MEVLEKWGENDKKVNLRAKSHSGIEDISQQISDFLRWHQTTQKILHVRFFYFNLKMMTVYVSENGKHFYTSDCAEQTTLCSGSVGVC